MPANSVELLNLAERAIRYVRSRMPYGAGNKMYALRGRIPPSRHYTDYDWYKDEKAKFLDWYYKEHGWRVQIPRSKRGKVSAVHRDAHLKRANELRKEFTGQLEHEWIRYGQKAMNFGCGDCIEQSAAAFAVLLPHCFAAGIPIDIVTTIRPGDHSFVVMGHPTFLRGAMRDQPYPKYFSVWSWLCVICDVWANIACYAPDYPRLFRDQMYKWDTRGITINGVLPTDLRWFNCLEAHHKVSMVRPYDFEFEEEPS